MFFLPEGVETCFSSTKTGPEEDHAASMPQGDYPGSRAFENAPLVADMNYAAVDSPLGWTCSSDAGSNTGGNQTPNGNIAADTEISVASHEISETITDPEGTAWWDSAGNEVGDDSAYVYGDSQSFQGSAGAKYNQTINGHHYFIQTEFSNQDFKTKDHLIIQQEDAVTVSPRSGRPDTKVTASGTGFASGETVTVTYAKTSTSTVKLCTHLTTATGSFSCSGTPTRRRPRACTRSWPRETPR